MSASPVITYRQLGPNNDPLWGNGQLNYLADLAAVAQAVLTRLQLFEGEWWAATNDGLPLFQSILGQSAAPVSQQQSSLLITARILGSPYIVSIGSVVTSFNSVTRQPFAYSAVVQSQFGQFQVSNVPQPPSGALP
jgi:hypothetical protein